MALRVQEFRNDAGEVSFVDYNLREKLALSEIDRWSEVFRFISRGQPLALLANSGRCWKAWEYRRWVEGGLVGESTDPFEAAKWQQVLAGGRIFCATSRIIGSTSRTAQELRTED